MAHARVLTGSEWPIWKHLRLRALADDEAYAAALQAEGTFADADWRERLLEERAAKFAGGAEPGRDDGILAAFLHKDAAVTELYSMWVAPAGRRRGVASALLRTARRWAQDQGSEVLLLKVFVDNAGAQRLYQGLGFVLTDVRSVHELSGRTELEMAMSLTRFPR